MDVYRANGQNTKGSLQAAAATKSSDRSKKTLYPAQTATKPGVHAWPIENGASSSKVDAVVKRISTKGVGVNTDKGPAAAAARLDSSLREANRPKSGQISWKCRP